MDWFKEDKWYSELIIIRSDRISSVFQFTGDLTWDHSGRTLPRNRAIPWFTYSGWPKREPSGSPDDCVFKDGYEADDPETFGYADYECDRTTWRGQFILALCEQPNENK